MYVHTYMTKKYSIVHIYPNYPKKNRFQSVPIVHCAYITYSLKTLILKISLYVNNKNNTYNVSLLKSAYKKLQKVSKKT